MNESKIKLQDMKEILCPCGHNRFEGKITMREISEILTGKPTIIQPIHIIVCEKCGKIFETPQIITS